MKRLCLPLLLVFCLLLSSCGAGASRKQYEQFSQELSSQSSLSFTAQLRAEYEDKTAEFTLCYERDEDGQTVTVLAPELIAGVKAHIAAGNTALEYDGVRLDTGELDSYGLTHMSALPVLVDAMLNGHLDSRWQEDGKSVCQLISNDHLSVSVWFETESMTPVRAELASDGRVTVCCEISDWKY